VRDKVSTRIIYHLRGKKNWWQRWTTTVKWRSKKAIIILSAEANNCERKRCKKQMMGEHDDKEFEVIKQQVASEIFSLPTWNFYSLYLFLCKNPLGEISRPAWIDKGAWGRKKLFKKNSNWDPFFSADILVYAHIYSWDSAWSGPVTVDPEIWRVNTVEQLPPVLSMWPRKIKMDEEKSKHAVLAQRSSFGRAFFPSIKWSPGFDDKCLPGAYISTFFKVMGILPQVKNMCTRVKIVKLLVKIFFMW
jgi:hypothetical protein